MFCYTDDAILHHGVLDPGIDLIQKLFSGRVLTEPGPGSAKRERLMAQKCFCGVEWFKSGKGRKIPWMETFAWCLWMLGFRGFSKNMQ